MKHRTWIELDGHAFSQNLSVLRQLATNTSQICAVVKANAYGHGAKEIVELALQAGHKIFAVDSLDEALRIRTQSATATIIQMGYILQDTFETAIVNRIECTVVDYEQLKRFEQIAKKQGIKARVHLKLETGLGRQGITERELPEVFQILSHSLHLELSGIYSHFANIDEADSSDMPRIQFERFEQMRQLFESKGFVPPWIHLGSSTAAILYPDTHYTLVRAGIALYGYWPSKEVEILAHHHNIRCDLAPVLHWKTTIAQIKSLPAGSPIGYGCSEIIKKQSRIAIIPVGYYDGYPRLLSNKADVLIAGNRCKILGRICMNMMMVDVSSLPNIGRETEVVLIGRSGRHEITANELAHHASTISYEILARLRGDIPRIMAQKNDPHGERDL